MELGQFNKRMQALSRNLQVQVDQKVRDIAETTLTDIANNTPYDTGNARINWQVVLDHRSNVSIYDYRFRPPVSPRGGYRGGPAAGIAVANGLPIIAGYDGTRHNAIHITNNVRYIGRLNAGYSKQAPARYVQLAIAAALVKSRLRSFNLSGRP